MWHVTNNNTTYSKSRLSQFHNHHAKVFQRKQALQTPTKQLLERGLVVSHHVVDGGAPKGQALLLHAEEGRLQQQFERLASPRPPRVLVLREGRQQLRAGQERGRISPAGGAAKRVSPAVVGGGGIS